METVAHVTHKDNDAAQPSGKLPPRSAIADAGLGDAVSSVALDGYQITARLGAGGMGTVWRALQLSTRREIALKLLNASGSVSESAKQRFEREVDVASRLEHPNIARVYDSGVHEGAYFYAMELIEGETLDENVGRRKLDRRSILELVARICRAIQYAHQKGVIH